MRMWTGRSLRRAGSLVAALLIGLGLGLASPASAAPVRCRIGAFVVSLSQVDTATGTFKADFWLWSVCPTPDLEPLKTMEFINGVETAGSLDSTIRRGDRWWSTRKISGTFRQDFSLKNYPFDEQPLEIDIEEGVLDARDLVYAADRRESGMDPAVDLPGWRLKDFRVLARIADHPTTFGDPSLPGGTSQYAALTLQVGVERAHLANFVKATFPIYIAALLALVSLTVTDGRMSLLGTTTFAVVLSFVSVERVVGPHDGVYLLDQLHFAALALIMAATVWGVLSLRAIARGEDAVHRRRRDLRTAAGLASGYILLNVLLVGLAIAAAGR